LPFSPLQKTDIPGFRSGRAKAIDYFVAWEEPGGQTFAQGRDTPGLRARNATYRVGEAYILTKEAPIV